MNHHLGVRRQRNPLTASRGKARIGALGQARAKKGSQLFDSAVALRCSLQHRASGLSAEDPVATKHRLTFNPDHRESREPSARSDNHRFSLGLAGTSGNHRPGGALRERGAATAAESFARALHRGNLRRGTEAWWPRAPRICLKTLVRTRRRGHGRWSKTDRRARRSWRPRSSITTGWTSRERSHLTRCLRIGNDGRPNPVEVGRYGSRRPTSGFLRCRRRPSNSRRASERLRPGWTR